MFNIEYNTLIKTQIMDNIGRGIFVLGLIFVFKLGYYWLQNSGITKGDLTSFGIYSYILYTTFNRFGNFQIRITKSILCAERLFKIMDYKPRIDCKAFEEEKDTGIIRELEGNIELKNVNFNYPSKIDVPVIQNFNLKIKKGEKIGIVGLSGSGKSTIVNLLERLYEINNNSKSEILYDGINIKEYNLRNFHNQIGYVCQEPALLDKSILENVIYGVDKYNENDVKKSLLMSKADFVYNKNYFPNGINTIVGEKGSKLSGGQKQRIAIARALIKKPKILILDEATSALDSKSEFELQQELNNLNKDMTIIIVAHRLSTIINCDKIVVIEKGIIKEIGNHLELIKLNGLYKQLMEKQMNEKENEVKDNDNEENE
jgi:ATP-binding cassette subfamily B (MDR/TAP) protein 1